MKTKIGKYCAAVCGAVMLLAMTGCEPDKITITVPVSAIQKVMNGETTYLKTRATGFEEFAPDSILEKKGAIESVIRNGLGKGGRFDMRKKSSGIEFTANWKVPLCLQNALPKDSDAYPLLLVMTQDKSRLILVTNDSRIKAMNEKLSDIDFTMDDISPLGMTEIVIENDTDTEFKGQVCGAFIDGKPKIHWTETIPPGDDATFSFGRKSTDSIWHDSCPTVFLK